MQVFLYFPLPLTHCPLFWWGWGGACFATRSSFTICGDHCKMKMWDPPVQILWRISKWRQQSIKPSWIPSKSGALCEFTGRMPVKQPCLHPRHWLFQMASSRRPGPLVSSWLRSMRRSTGDWRVEERTAGVFLPLFPLPWWLWQCPGPSTPWPGDAVSSLCPFRSGMGTASSSWQFLGTSIGLVIFLSPIYSL